MKKNLLGLLVLSSLFAVSGCELFPDGTPNYEELVSEAGTFYYQSLKATEKTNDSYELKSKITIAGVEYSLAWELVPMEGALEGVIALASEVNQKGNYDVTIDQSKSIDADTTYALKCTLTGPEGKTSSFELNRYVQGVKSGRPEVVSEIQVGVPYKFGCTQDNLGKDLFFEGNMSGNYLKSADNYILGAWVYVEAGEAENTYHMYTMVGETKTYINISTYYDSKKQVNKNSQSLSTTEKTVYKWDKDLKTLVAHIDLLDADFYLGTYSTYNTISSSNVSYASTSFVCHFWKMPELKPTMITTPEVGVAYKFYLEQENLGKNLYMKAEKSGNYIASTENSKEAADVYVEAGEVADTYYLYTLVGETKTYINIPTYFDSKKQVNKNSQDLSTTEKTAYKWDANLNTLVAHVDLLNGDFYLGTYSTYNTISSSNVSYASTSFVCHLGVIEDRDPVIMDSIAVGVPYKFTCNQEKLGKRLYLTGNKSGNYLESSSKAADACDVYVEAGEVADTYYLYTLVGETKTYINIPTYFDSKKQVNKNSQDFSTTEKTAYKWDANLKTLVAHIDLLDGDFYLGTYSTYNTISSSNVSYASTSFVCQFALVYED